MDVVLRRLTEADLPLLWSIGFSEEQPSWKEWDAPYFDDYERQSLSDFCQQHGTFFTSSQVSGIWVAQQLIGVVTYYWEDRRTRWLNVGIVIYNSNYWNGGYGTQVLRQWVAQVFAVEEAVQRVGLVTWSGNERMMRCAEKIGMRQEGRVRRVRYYQGTYYDSVIYGVLRDEWESVQ